MTFLAVGVSAGASILTGVMANKQAQKGVKAQVAGQQAAIDEQRRQYDQTRGDLNPYMQFGQQAIPGLSALNSGDYSGFMNSPDYLAARDLGQSQIDRSAGARGGLFGGGNTRDSIKFGGQLASQYLGNYRNSLFQQAGMGQNAAAGLGGLGANMANQIGNAYGNMGDARQSGYNSTAQTIAGTAGSLNGIFQQYMSGRDGRQSGYTASGTGSVSGMPYTAPATASGDSWLNGYGRN